MHNLTTPFGRCFRIHGGILRCRCRPRGLHLYRRGGSVIAVRPSPPPISDSTTTTQPFQQCVDEDGVECLELNFREEPLGVASKHGFGHYDAQFGEVIGPADGSSKYCIERKLAWGSSSSVWLAREFQKHRRYRFVALKILSSHFTHWHHKGACIEVDALALLMGHPNIIQPFRDFTIPAKRGGRDRRKKEEHIVIATALYSGSLYDILEGCTEQFPPLSFVKRAPRQVLHGLAYMHSRNFVHTDLKQTPVLVDNGGLTNVDINALLATDPPRRYPPELSEFRPVEVAVSQPLPAPTIEEAMTRTFCISDMGSVCGKQCLKVGENLSPRDLQAPEVILGAPLDEKVDIWLFGLLAYETVTGEILFDRPTELEPEAPNFPTSYHLWQICALLNDVDTFPPYLRDGVYAKKYLNSDGVIMEPLLPKQRHGNLRRVLDKKRPGLDPAEGDAIAAILHRCLKLDPRERPSAAELLEDPWWAGVVC